MGCKMFSQNEKSIENLSLTEDALRCKVFGTPLMKRIC